jgi:hypothetical protein
VLGKSSSELGVTRRTQPWARHRCKGTRGRGPWSSPTTAQFALGSNCADNRAVHEKLRAWGSFSFREGTLERLSNDGDAGRPWVDDDGALAAW